MDNKLKPQELAVYQLFLDNPNKKFNCMSKELIAHFNKHTSYSGLPSNRLSHILSELNRKGVLTRKMSRVNQKTCYGNRMIKIYFYKLKPITK